MRFAHIRVSLPGIPTEKKRRLRKEVQNRDLGALIICFKEGDHCSEFTVDVCTQIWARKTNVLPLMSIYKVTGFTFQEDGVV